MAQGLEKGRAKGERRNAIACLLTALLLLAACGWGDTRATILPEGLPLREGDVVFRRGTGVTSRIVVTADIHGCYSHVGIVAQTDSGLMVIHAVPDEPDFPGDEDRVKAERPERFFSTFRADRGAVCRAADSTAARRAAQYALQACQQRVPFDHDYDDLDTTSLYCTELVVRAYSAASLPLVGAERQSLHVPGIVSAECIFPSDLFNSGKLKAIDVF